MRNNEFSAKNRADIFTDPGDPISPIYKTSVLHDGSIELTEIGTENTDELIHSHRESTDLKTILARFSNGDVSALNKFQGYYADVSEYPKDLRSALEQIINAESAFLALPLDLRRQYDNDWRKWIVAAGSKSWISDMLEFVPGFVDPYAKPEEEKSDTGE